MLEKLFFLDGDDMLLIGQHRGPRMMFGFALQLVTVRYLGTFLNDPLDVPTGVADCVAEKLSIADPSCVKRYTERRPTRFEHQEEIKCAYGLQDFAAAEADLAAWVDTPGLGHRGRAKAIFTDAVAWLRNRRVLLPGGDRAGPAGSPGEGGGHRPLVGHHGGAAHGPAGAAAGSAAGGSRQGPGVQPGAVAQDSAERAWAGHDQGAGPSGPDHRAGAGWVDLDAAVPRRRVIGFLAASDLAGHGDLPGGQGDR